MSVPAEVTRVIGPDRTYGWLVQIEDLMIDLIVRDGAVISLDRSAGFSGLPGADLKRLAALRLNDILVLLGVERSSVQTQKVFVEVPDETYQLLRAGDHPSVQSGFSDLMVWVGRELTV